MITRYTPNSFQDTVLSVLDHMLEGCQIISPEWRYLYVNDVVAKQGKSSREKLLGKTMMECYPGIEKTEMFSMLRQCMEDRVTHHMDNEFTFPDGSKGWFELRMEPVPEGVFILSIDITQRIRAQEKVRWLMRHDPVTGLPNKLVLIESLEKQAALNSGTLSLVSLENAMEIEATFGVPSTDEILRQLTFRLKNAFLEGMSAYRLHSNQLAILFLELEHEVVYSILENLTEIFRKPFTFKGIFIHADIRMGCVTFGKEEKEPHHYLREANAALIKACESSQNRINFSRDIDLAINENLELLGELTEALHDGQLKLHYQPKIQLKDGKVHGVEALMRWNHAKLGNIPPNKFIPRAEKSTLIDSLTDWAMDQALLQSSLWKKKGLNISLAVNISTRNLLQPNFVDIVLKLLDKHEVDGELLELEITEGSLVVDVQRTIADLAKLSGSNIVVSIDDFGTGYSSLQYLSDLPVSIIKIDRSFVNQLPFHAGKAHIVEAAVSLCSKLGMEVVAEGVEKAEAYNFLSEIGCHMAQGYLISKALPASDFFEWHRKSDGHFVMNELLQNS